MIIGDPALFAIESSITKAYARRSLRALGYFVLHVRGQVYGVREHEASMLANSFDAVGARLRNRGLHTAPFAANTDTGTLAMEFRQTIYGDKPKSNVLGMPADAFQNLFAGPDSRMWAPDGDAAFDDGSFVLQFDIGTQVRMIAFRSQGESYAAQTLQDVFLEEWRVYDVLQRWREAFEEEWQLLEKTPE